MGNLDTKITISAVDKVSPVLRGIGASFQRMKAQMSGVSAAFSNVSSAASDFGSRIRNLALVAGVAGGAMFALAKAQGQYAEHMNILSQKTGISTDTLQKWNYVASLNNMSIDDMVVGMRGLSKAMVAASSDPKSDVAKWFKKNNIAIKDAKGNLLPFEGVIEKIADRFKDAPDGPMKMAVAMKLLGKQGANLIPILNLGAKNIQELMKKANLKGLVIPPEVLKSQGEFDDHIDDMMGSINGLKMAIASRLIPIFQPLVMWMEKYIDANRVAIAQNIGDTFSQIGDGLLIFGKGLWAVGQIIAPVVKALGGLKAVVAGVLAVYTFTLAASFARLAWAMLMVIPATLRLIPAFYGLAVAAWAAIAPMLAAAAPFIIVGAAIGLIGYALYKLISQFGEFRQAWLQLWSQLPEPVQYALRAVLGVATMGMSEVVRAISNNWESIKASFQKGGLSQVFADMFAGAKEAVVNAMSGISEALSGFVDKIKSFFAPLTGLMDSIVNGIMKIKNAISGGVSGTIDVKSNMPAGVSTGGGSASIGAGAPAATPASPAGAKTSMNTTPTLKSQPTIGNVASATPQRQHLDVYMKIDAEGRPKGVTAKASGNMNFAANTGRMV